MMNENNSNINLYAQLPTVAEIRTETVGPRLSAGAAPHKKKRKGRQQNVGFILMDRRIYFEIGNEFKNLL